MDKGTYLFCAIDDSMEPQIQDGDKLLIEDTPRHKISSGDLCLVSFFGRLYVRCVVPSENGVVLRALNSAYHDITIAPKDTINFSVLGKELYAIPRPRKISNIYEQ